MKKIFYILTFLFYLTHFVKSQWIDQNSGTSQDLNSISSPNNSVSWISATQQYIYRSTNEGLNWSLVYNSSFGETIYCIYAMSTDTALWSIGTSSSKILRTTNGGINWVTVFPLSTEKIRSIILNSPLNGIAVGDVLNSTRWSIYKTNNGGQSWDSSGLYITKLYDECTFNNGTACISSNLWFTSSKNKIYHSTDFGSTWQIQNPVLSSTMTDNRYVWFNDLNNGITNVENQISYTTNGGLTWQPIAQQLTGNVIGGIMGTNTEFWVALDKYIYSTTNLGTNWVLEYTSPDNQYYNFISKSRNGTSAWATRNGGKISKGSNINGVKPISSIVPSLYNLYQNYPNPFNPSTKIKFDIRPPLTPLLGKEGTGVVLKIYDILGHEVTTLVNEKLSPGTYEVEFNGANYSSGIYFYKLSAGSYTETKKLMLIK